MNAAESKQKELETTILKLRHEIEFYKGNEDIEKKIQDVKSLQIILKEKLDNVEKNYSEKNDNFAQIFLEKSGKISEEISILDKKIQNLDIENKTLYEKHSVGKMENEIRQNLKFKSDMINYANILKEDEIVLEKELQENKNFLKEQEFLNKKYSQKFNSIIEKVNEDKILDYEIFQKIEEIHKKEANIRKKIENLEESGLKKRVENLEKVSLRKLKKMEKYKNPGQELLDKLNNLQRKSEEKREKKVTFMHGSSSFLDEGNKYWSIDGRSNASGLSVKDFIFNGYDN